MKTQTPANPDYVTAVRESFARQTLMKTLGAAIADVRPGAVDIALPYADHIGQQNGFVHAGAVSAIADSSCGYAAFSLAPAGYDVLTVEFKINLLNPARGQLFTAQGRVLKHGRSLTICESRVITHKANEEVIVAVMLASIIMRPIPA